MGDEFDPWKLETGLLTNYVGVVEDAWFTFDPVYNNGDTLIMKWKMKTDQPGDLEEWTEGWPVGKDWKTLDSGKTAEHPQGQNRSFNQASQFAKVLAKLNELGAIEQLKGMGRRDPRVAATFVGIKVRMEPVVVGKNMKTNNDVTKNLPVVFYGVEGVGGGVGSTPQQTQQTTTLTPPVAAPTNGTNGQTDVDIELAGLPINIQEAIKAFAKSMNHSDWCDAVLATDPVPTKLNVVMALSNETGLYTRLRTSA